MKRDFKEAATPKDKALFKALEHDDSFELFRLLESGADANALSQTPGFFRKLMYETPYAPKSSPLHLAALAGNRLSVLLLLRYGAELNAVNAEGQTPLDYALTNLGHYESLKAAPKKILGLRFGAKAKKIDQNILRYELVVKALLRAGAAPGLFRLPEKFMPFLMEKDTRAPRP